MSRKDAVLAAVDELAGDLVELLQALIRLPTINPPGDGYEAFVHDFASRLDALGYATEVHRVPEEDLATLAPHGDGLPRPNLIATLEQRRRARPSTSTATTTSSRSATTGPRTRSAASSTTAGSTAAAPPT